MSIGELMQEYEDQLRRLWEQEVATTNHLDVGFDHYLTMSDEIDGQRFPILVGMHENGIADGEIIANGFFEDIVSAGGLDFDADVPEKVNVEIGQINDEAGAR